MEQFLWQQHPEAEQWLKSQYEALKNSSARIQALENEFLQKTSTRLFDWISHITLPFENEIPNHLESLGFEREIKTENYVLYHHPGAQFPRIVLCFKQTKGLSILADEISSFFLANRLDDPIEGMVLGAFRKGIFHQEKDLFLACVERRGTRSIEPTHESKEQIVSFLLAKEMWRTRPRALSDEEKMMRITLELAKTMVEMVGSARAACCVLEVEREYWQSRNFAGQIQKMRQDQLGLGWANHDHHTFRSSRRFFRPLIQLFELLGFYCRERFYAGKEAGWGAQVMENSVIQSVLFLDVDLDPDELAIDFAHLDLHEKDHLGTVGLWCGLHGESIFQGGMHHLEAQFNHKKLTEDLTKMSIGMMDPFSKFDYLKQSFTKGERWKVDPRRLEKLLQEKLITKEQREKFAQEGALGSHLENLERNAGFKGFNQKNVSDIIHQTDPRTTI
jgi:hypothetical protein